MCHVQNQYVQNSMMSPIGLFLSHNRFSHDAIRKVLVKVQQFYEGACHKEFIIVLKGCAVFSSPER